MKLPRRGTAETTGHGQSFNFKRMGATCLIGLAAAGTVEAVNVLSGDRADISFGPAKAEPGQAQDHMTLITWNVRKQGARKLAHNILRLKAAYDFDALGLQEVTTDAARQAGAILKAYGLYGRYDEADNRQNPENGGNGIMIVSPHKPENYEADLFKGDSNAEAAAKTAWNFTTKDLPVAAVTSAWAGISAAGSLAGLKQSNPDLSLSNSRKGLAENRNAIGVTLKIDLEGKPVKFRFLTSHMPSQVHKKTHDRQYKSFFKVLGANTKKGMATFACLDWNEDSAPLRTPLGSLNYKIAETSSNSMTTTTEAPYRSIDKCAVSTGGLAVSTVATVIQNPMGSDHKPKMLTVTYNR